MVEGPALKETRFHLPGSVKDTDVGSCFERPKRTDDKNIREMAQSSAHAGTVWHSEQPKSQKQKKKRTFVSIDLCWKRIPYKSSPSQ